MNVKILAPFYTISGNIRIHDQTVQFKLLKMMDDVLIACKDGLGAVISIRRQTIKAGTHGITKERRDKLDKDNSQLALEN